MLLSATVGNPIEFADWLKEKHARQVQVVTSNDRRVPLDPQPRKMEGKVFKKIMVPVDLAHLDKLERALDVASDLAKHYQASVCFVGVTSPQPSAAGERPPQASRRADATRACPRASTSPGPRGWCRWESGRC